MEGNSSTAGKGNPLNRRILKAFGLFGSVEGLLILFSVLRTKFVAVLLGSSGVGLFTLFFSAIDLVGSTTQMSISESAIRNISAAGTPENKSSVVTGVIRWAWVLGVFGAVCMLIAAPLFSYFTFGDLSWTWAYMILSAVVLLNSVSKGFTAVMRGLEAFRGLATFQVYGSAGGLIVSIPLFYYMRLDSIVPSFVAYAVVATVAGLIICRTTIRRQGLVRRDEPWRESLRGGIPVIRLGAYMTVSTFASLASSYIFMAWLNENTDTSTVGYFNAGFTIVNRYVGVLISAISVEYYPRLSRELSQGKPVGESVEAEIKLALPLLLPCVILFMLLSRYIVAILYTSDFEVIEPFVNWAMIGTMFRLVSYCFAFVILAKGDGKIYVVTEVLSAIVYVSSSILCFKGFGITGLGYSYIIWYAIYTVSVMTVYRFRYGLGINTRIFILTGLSLSAAFISIVAINLGFIWGAVVLLAVTGFFAAKKIRESF